MVAAVKNGLEQDGLGDLVLEVGVQDAGAPPKSRKLLRRRRFVKKEIYLPKVMVEDGAEVREIDYETDILSRIDWRGFDPRPIAERVPLNAQFAENQFQRITITDDDDRFAGESVSGATETLRFDASYAVRTILDIVPNPFVGREIVGGLLDTLRERGFDARRLGALAGLIVTELRNGLQTARDDRAERVFKQDAANGRIQFHLRLDGGDWRMPFHMDTTAPENAPQVFSQSGGPLGKSWMRSKPCRGGTATSRVRNTASRAGKAAESIPISSSRWGRTESPSASPSLKPRATTSTTSTPATSAN